MAKELTQNTQASQILSELSQKNYFVQRHASQNQVYQYHNLFREFLISRARETLRAEELSILRHAAAGMCETEGMIEDATVFALKLVNRHFGLCSESA